MDFSVRKAAAYIIARAKNMPDTAVLTEEELEIKETEAFSVAHMVDDMYGKFIIGYIGEKFVLYRKINRNDNPEVYADLIKSLKISEVIVALKAEPTVKTDTSVMQMKDFIRLYDTVRFKDIKTLGKSGGVYAISHGKCTEAEKVALKNLGADAVGENALPAYLSAEGIKYRGIMVFKPDVENEICKMIEGGKNELEI